MSQHSSTAKSNKSKNKSTKKVKPRKLKLDPSAWGDEKPVDFILSGLEEDIIVGNGNETIPKTSISTIRAPNGSNPPPSSTRKPSLPTSTFVDKQAQIFVEGKRRFVAKSAQHVAEEQERMRLQRRFDYDPSSNDSRGNVDSRDFRSTNLIQIAIHFQTFFQRFAHLTHGVLAGFCTWQCVVVYLLYRAGENVIANGGLDFVFGLYAPLAMPVNSALAFLLTVAFLSALDDLDIASSDSRAVICPQFVTLYSVLRAFLMPVLIVSFVINNVLVQKESTISNLGIPGLNMSSGWNTTQTTLRRDLAISWLSLNMARSIAALLSWCLVVVARREGGVGDAQILTLTRRKADLLGEGRGG